MFDLRRRAFNNWNPGQQPIPCFDSFTVKTDGGDFAIHHTATSDITLREKLTPFLNSAITLIRFTQSVGILGTILIATHGSGLWIVVTCPLPLDFLDLLNRESPRFYLFGPMNPALLAHYGIRAQFRPAIFNTAELQQLQAARAALDGHSNVNLSQNFPAGTLGEFLQEFSDILCILIVLQPPAPIKCPICFQSMSDLSGLFGHFVSGHGLVPAPSLPLTATVAFFQKQLTARFQTFSIGIAQFCESITSYACPVCQRCDCSVSDSLRHLFHTLLHRPTRTAKSGRMPDLSPIPGVGRGCDRASDPTASTEVCGNACGPHTRSLTSGLCGLSRGGHSSP
jgi:hypothetical protein